MSGWKDLLIAVIKLTDEVKRINHTLDRAQSNMYDVGKRVVRLETMVELAKSFSESSSDALFLEMTPLLS